MHFGYAGVFAGYMIRAREKLDIIFGSLIGAGSLGFVIEDDRYYYSDETNYKRDAFFIAEPEVTASYEIVTYLHVDLSLAYRIVAGVNKNANSIHGESGKGEERFMESSDLSGFSAGFSINVGNY